MSPVPAVSDEMLSRLDVPGPRYTSYPTVPEWTAEFGPEAFADRLKGAGKDADQPLSYYVHLPFCKERCTFCGCNVVITKDRQRADKYIDYLAKEMDRAVGLLEDRTKLSQIHWGGGTPTFLSEEQIERFWKEIVARFEVTSDAEVAIEIDPTVTSERQLDVLRRLGFNRVSMGVQDFDPQVQESIKRVQSVEETRALLEHARALGFSGVNFDLIHGLPHQTPSSWKETLDTVLEMRPDRVAVYSFAWVPKVKPHQKKLEVLPIPKARDKMNLFRMAYEAFLGAGYRQIGMDHFALPEDELSLAQDRRTLGRNFQGYTVKSATDAVAFGITGISDVHGAYAQNVPGLPKYYAALDEDRFATDRGIVLTDDDRIRREVIASIMCNFWVDLGDRGGTYFERELEGLREMETEGLLAIDGNEIELTSVGRLFVRNVAMVFDAYLGSEASRHSFSRTV